MKFCGEEEERQKPWRYSVRLRENGSTFWSKITNFHCKSIVLVVPVEEAAKRPEAGREWGGMMGFFQETAMCWG